MENRNPVAFESVQVWAAQAQYNFPPANALIEALEFENIGNNIISDKQHTMLFCICTGPFILNFSWIPCHPGQPSGYPSQLGPVLQNSSQLEDQLI